MTVRTPTTPATSATPPPAAPPPAKVTTPVTPPVTPEVEARAAKFVDRTLTQAGYESGIKGEKFTTKTRDSLKQFQTARGIDATGQLDQPTMKELRAVQKTMKDHKGSKVFTTGMKGDQVRDAEKRLNKLGYDAGKADGIYDAKTATAVKQFKKDENLKNQSGLLGETGRKELKAAARGLNHEEYRGRVTKDIKAHKRDDAATAKAVAKGPVGEGAENKEAVSNIQERLRRAGFDPSRTDGKFDARTTGAVKAFQEKAGLKVTGEVNGATWKKLDKSVMYAKDGTSPAQRVGEKSAAVKRSEVILKKLGYDVGEADGIFDAKTAAASKKFEKKFKGTGDDGAIGEGQLTRMKRVLHAKEDPGKGPTLKKGYSGNPVKQLQQRLEKYGYEVGKIDGDFGDKTKSAVKRFQKAFGLQADGVVGKATWKMLSVDAKGKVNKPGSVGGVSMGNVSGSAKAQMAALVRTAIAGAAGRSPQGWCLKRIGDYLDQISYGGIGRGALPRMPYAKNVAEYLNAGDRWKSMGLKRLNIDNPYEAPAGAIVVVRPGTPGTAHPTAGDIVVAAGGGRFLNDGEMGYGGSGNFPPGNNYVLGVYIPA